MLTAQIERNPRESVGVRVSDSRRSYTGATWNQVQLRLIDGHTLSVAVDTRCGVFNYAQLGMINRKNGHPSVQWELLRVFAEGGGTLTWQCRGADRRNQKRRELLARTLKEFFRIEGDPIASCNHGWRTCFHISVSG